MILPLLIGFILQIKSMNELKFILYEDGFKYILIHTVKKSIENVKIFETTFFMDNVVPPLMIVTTCMAMILKSLFKMIRARWDLENIFKNLNNECNPSDSIYDIHCK